MALPALVQDARNTAIAQTAIAGFVGGANPPRFKENYPPGGLHPALVVSNSYLLLLGREEARCRGESGPLFNAGIFSSAVHRYVGPSSKGGTAVFRHRAIVLSVLCLVFSGVRSVSAVVQYTVTDLGTLGGPWSYAYGINASGQVVGWSDMTSSSPYSPYAFLYSNGTMTNLGTVPNGGGTQANGINDSGQIVGQTTGGNGNGFLYSNGVMTLVNTPAGYSSSQPTAINDSGQIAGFFYKGNNPWNTPERAFLYSNGTMQDLGTLPSGGSSYATGVNANGQVVGGSGNGYFAHAFLYSAGTMTDLGTISAKFDGSSATGINASGQVVGYCDVAEGYYQHAFLYSNGTMADLGTFGGLGSQALGINSSGQVVGWAEINGGYKDAFLDSNGTMTDLNSLIDPASGWILGSANAINDSGQIAGCGYVGGNDHAFLLTPIPEPSTLALLLAGVVGVLALAWRRV